MTPDAHLQAAIASISQARFELANETPPWLMTARGEIGVKEVVGKEHNARVLEYLATCHHDRGGNIRDYAAGRDETPWCAAFVCWCLERGETVRGTRSAAARSYLQWGVELDKPRPGCVVVLQRSGGGHVAFFDHRGDEPSQIYLLGGNQSNRVSVAPYPLARVLSYRWPS